MPTADGLTTPLASQYPLTGSAMGTQMQLSYLTAMNQQRYLANQGRYLQLIQQQNATQAGQDVSTKDAKESSSTDSKTTRSNERRDKLRQANALKAVQSAERAAARGNTDVAERLFQKAITLAGTDEILRGRAESAMQALKE